MSEIPNDPVLGTQVLAAVEKDLDKYKNLFNGDKHIKEISDKLENLLKEHDNKPTAALALEINRCFTEKHNQETYRTEIRLLSATVKELKRRIYQMEQKNITQPPPYGKKSKPKPKSSSSSNKKKTGGKK